MNTPLEPEFINIPDSAPINPAPDPTPVPDPTATEPTAPEKKKRGRPKKTDPKPDGDAPKFEKPKESSSIFDEIKKEVENNEKNLNQLNNPTGTPEGETPIHSAVKNIVDGYMLLTLMDTFFPMLLKLAYKKAKKLKDKDIQLSKDQKEHLEPIADEIAQQLLSFMDPVSLFFVMAGAMYFQNTSEALANVKQ
jgi:hypothetical protein